jgi:predicted restriction endonuclease
MSTVINKFSVITGKQQAASKVGRVIGIHIKILSERRRQFRQFGFNDNAIKGWFKLPHRRSAQNRLAREHAASVDRAWPDTRSNQEHGVC